MKSSIWLKYADFCYVYLRYHVWVIQKQIKTNKKTQFCVVIFCISLVICCRLDIEVIVSCFIYITVLYYCHLINFLSILKLYIPNADYLNDILNFLIASCLELRCEALISCVRACCSVGWNTQRKSVLTKCFFYVLFFLAILWELIERDKEKTTATFPLVCNDTTWGVMGFTFSPLALQDYGMMFAVAHSNSRIRCECISVWVCKMASSVQISSVLDSIKICDYDFVPTAFAASREGENRRT